MQSETAERIASATWQKSSTRGELPTVRWGLLSKVHSVPTFVYVLSDGRR